MLMLLIIMIKNDNSEDDEAYYEQFKFLNNSQSSKGDLPKNSYVKEVPRIRGAVTADQHNNNLDLTSGVKSVMEEDIQSNFGDSLILLKTDGQKMIESPDMNKKMRTQIDYKEAIKGNQHSKKSIQDEISFKESNVDFLLKKEDKNKLINEEMKTNPFNKTDDKEVLKMKNLIPENQADSKLKVYKVKKTKAINQGSEVSEKSNLEIVTGQVVKIKDRDIDITKSDTNFRTNIYLSSSLILGSVFLLKLYKKLKK